MIKSGQGIYFGKECSKKTHKDFFPNKHQTYVVDFFLKSTNKGLLLYHKLGSGKSCTSIMVADEMIKENKINHVYVLTPGSLRENWLYEYCNTCGHDSEYLKRYYTFITYNYDVVKNLNKLNFNNSLIIIDEAHNLINGVKNISKNAYAIYEKIMRSNCKVLALTGTPIFNQTNEWSILGNMLKPGSFVDLIDKSGINPIFKYKQWNENVVKSIKNNQNILKDIISYYPGDPSFYPQVNYFEPIKCFLPEEISEKFIELYDFEKKRRQNPPSEQLKFKNPEKYMKDFTDYILAIKFIRTRALSNFYYWKKAYRYSQDILTTEKKPIPKKKLEREKLEELKRLEKETAEDIEDDDINSEIDVEFNKFSEYGWVDDEALSNKALLKYNEKFAKVLINIVKHLGTKQVVYTFFKTKHGVELFHTLLNKCGIKAEIYSGDLSSTARETLKNKFNNVNNRNGEKISVLLLTEAGAEGITLLETNNIHILESSTRENRTRQAIGRVVRFKSHYNMPKQRQYVNVFRYWSMARMSYDKKSELYNSYVSIDEDLYKKGIEKEAENQSFLNMLIENSIENN